MILKNAYDDYNYSIYNNDNNSINVRFLKLTNLCLKFYQTESISKVPYTIKKKKYKKDVEVLIKCTDFIVNVQHTRHDQKDIRFYSCLVSYLI